MTRIDDGHRPHQFPTPVPDCDVISWKCRACGRWIYEGEEATPPCPVDWRRR